MSLRVKVLLPYVAFVIVAVALFQLVWEPSHTRSVLQERLALQEDRLRIVASGLLPDVLAQDLAKIHESLAGVAADHPRWEAVVLTDAEGRQLFPLEETPRDEALLWVEHIERQGERPRFSLRLGLDGDALRAEILSNLRRLELAILALLGGMALLALIGHEVWVRRPLERLSGVAARIADGDYDAALPADARDELGAFIRAFDRMRHSLRERETKLHETSQRLDSILNGLKDGIATIDDQGRILAANRAISDLFGYPAEELEGKNIRILMPEPYHSEHDDYLAAYRRTGEAKVIGIGREVHGRRRDGSVFPLELTVTEFTLGSKHYFTGLLRDITDRLEAGRKLHELLGMQTAILDGTSAAIFATDHNGIIKSANAAAERITGHSAPTLIGDKSLTEFFDPEEVARRAAALGGELERMVRAGFEVFSARAATGGTDEHEWTFIPYGAAPFAAAMTVTALRDGDEVQGFVAMVTDISERRKMDRMKSEFISMVSHELRTPLTSIRGSLGLIAGGAAGELPPKAGQLVGIAAKNSERLVRLINDILDVEKIEAGKMDFELEPLELDGLVDAAVAANQGYAEQYKVRLRVDNQAPGMRLEGDKDRLLQVFANLLSNACKFSPQGEEVTIRLEREGDWAQVSVEDRGEGVPEAFRDRIFQKFAQADSSDTRQKGGTGLGLSISRAIIQQLGGRIDFTSAPGAGTRFHFRLPLIQTAAPSPALANVVAEGASILICEDDADVASLLRMYLSEAGYQADVALTVREARARLAEREYGAMTLDLMLPDEDGLSFLRQLREDPRMAQMPVIVVSAKAEQGRGAVAGEALHVLDWLQKPIDNERLTGLLDQLFTHAGGDPENLPRILHVEDNADIREVVSAVLEGKAILDCAGDLAQARHRLAAAPVDLVLLDAGLPDGSGLDLLPELNKLRPPVSVVIFSAQQVPREVAKQVSGAMIKSSTTNEVLRDEVLNALGRRLARGYAGRASETTTIADH